MTQLKYLAITTLLLIGGCTTDDELSTGNGAQLSDDIRANDPDQAPDGRPAASVTTAGSDRPQQGQPCPADRNCGDMTCVSYYGIAGPAGGELNSCEYLCGDSTDCPPAQQCVTIYDGPGQVCRPIER